MRDAALTSRAKGMRKNMPEPERRLWNALRAKRFLGVPFRRQKVIGSYIADFAANDPKLVIEVDGDSHGSQIDYDADRTLALEEFGYRVIRFSNSDVMANMDGVLMELGMVIDGLKQPPLRALSPEGERAKT